MKSDHSSRLLLIVVMLFSFNNLHSQLAPPSKPNFNVRPQDHRYLWYIGIVNSFDSVNVEYTLGEIAVFGDSAQSLIFIALDSSDLAVNNLRMFSPKMTGITSTGVDTSIRSKAISRSFTIPSHASITFYRTMLASVPCNIVVNPNTGGPFENLNPFDAQLTPYSLADLKWTIPVPGVQDTTEYVIELVRSSDKAVLMVLDSVGVLPNSSHMAVRYGTGPDSCVVIRQLDSSLVGTVAYVRVSPRRYGSTAFGQTLQKSNSTFLRSLTINNSDLHSVRPHCFDALYCHGLDSLRNIELWNYCDSMAQANGCLPVVLGSFGSPSDSMISKVNVHMDSLGAFRGSWSLADTTIARNCLSISKGISDWYRSTIDMSGVWGKQTMDESKHKPSASGNKNSLIKVTCPDYMRIGVSTPMSLICDECRSGNLEVVLYDLQGRRIQLLYDGQAANLQHVTVEQVSAGLYYVVMFNKDTKEFIWRHSVVCSH